MVRNVVGSLVALSLFTGGNAFAAGITFGENGTKAVSMGGAFAGQADDLSAIQHNPAGLAQQRGTNFAIDLNVLNQDVRFERAQANVEAANNSGGLFLLPMIGVSHGLSLLERNLTLAVGLYGPPSVGRYQYPVPDYTRNEQGKFVSTPRKFAPQRYSLVGNDTIILYPTVAASFQVHKMVSVGVSVQYVYSKLHFAQSITTSDAINQTTTDPNIREDPNQDAQVAVDMVGKPTVTGILGVLVTPSDRMSFGLSVRPPVQINASGQMTVALGDLAKSSGAKVVGDCGDSSVDPAGCGSADLQLTLPLEVKLGTHFRPMKPLGINVDLVYEGWQSFSELVLTPKNLSQQIGAADPVPLSQIRIQKRWHHTFGARGGVSYAFPFGLEARAGVLFEQSAADPQYFSIDFPHLQRFIYTVGASYPIGPIEIAAAFAYTPSQSLEVTDSKVLQVTSTGIPGATVGNGTYTVSGWIGSVGIRGHFGVTPPAVATEQSVQTPVMADQPQNLGQTPAVSDQTKQTPATSDQTNQSPETAQ